MRVTVTRHYLEMSDPSELKPSRPPKAETRFTRVPIPMPELNRFFYTAVGGHWYWTDRLAWSHAKWMQYLDREELETWVVWNRDMPAGYIELESQPEKNIEIAYLGLLPPFIGKGLGGYLLTQGVRRAWERNPRRVWVHTCSLDHPGALNHYLARGFKVFKVEEYAYEKSTSPIGPWLGALDAADA